VNFDMPDEPYCRPMGAQRTDAGTVDTLPIYVRLIILVALIASAWFVAGFCVMCITTLA
jgi:hypothetical protein